MAQPDPVSDGIELCLGLRLGGTDAAPLQRVAAVFPDSHGNLDEGFLHRTQQLLQAICRYLNLGGYGRSSPDTVDPATDLQTTITGWTAALAQLPQYDPWPMTHTYSRTCGQVTHEHYYRQPGAQPSDPPTYLRVVEGEFFETLSEEQYQSLVQEPEDNEDADAVD